MAVTAVGRLAESSQADRDEDYNTRYASYRGYLLAFERRLLTPASLLDDSPAQIPTAAGLYLPQNYDREFKGPITLRRALELSRNVPAVALMQAGAKMVKLEGGAGQAAMERAGDWAGALEAWKPVADSLKHPGLNGVTRG